MSPGEAWRPQFVYASKAPVLMRQRIQHTTRNGVNRVKNFYCSCSSACLEINLVASGMQEVGRWTTVQESGPDWPTRRAAAGRAAARPDAVTAREVASRPPT